MNAKNKSGKPAGKRILLSRETLMVLATEDLLFIRAAARLTSLNTDESDSAPGLPPPTCRSRVLG